MCIGTAILMCRSLPICSVTTISMCIGSTVSIVGNDTV